MNKTVLYFSPHQDDELLIMGADIVRSVSTGMDVHVILCTDGSKCRIRDDLDLSPEQKTKYRDEEFKNSCRALGVSEDNIHIDEDRMTDKEADLEDGCNLIEKHIKKFDGRCVVCTLIPARAEKQHPDHYIIGCAALSLFAKGRISTMRLFGEPWISFPCHKLERYEADESQKKMIREAVMAYSGKSELGIGHYSCPGHFELLLNDMASYFIENKKDPEGERKIILSLASFPGRKDHISYSIKTLTGQKIPADKIVLYLAKEQYPERDGSFSNDLREMTDSGQVDVRWTEDAGPHKKYLCAFREFEDDLVITVDDDILHDESMTVKLLLSWFKHPGAVSAMRTHLIIPDREGGFRPYNEWFIQQKILIDRESDELLSTNGAGTIFEPKKLKKDIFDIGLMKTTCVMTADDLWIKAALLYSGMPVVQVPGYKGLKLVPGSQDVTLWSRNKSSNDDTWRRVEDWYDGENGEGSFKKAIFGPWSAIGFIRDIRYRKKYIGENTSRPILDRYFNKD
ncbi:MAG: PIG-L family deacetylase [Clostridiales bacterium]|nr:PIG-L family deacetylase [Clostridiales bacterium]